MTASPNEWLDALEDARREREGLHPHAPVLDPPRDQLSVGPMVMTPERRAAIEELRAHAVGSRFALTAEEREVGRQRVAELRALIDRVRDERHGVAS